MFRFYVKIGDISYMHCIDCRTVDFLQAMYSITVILSRRMHINMRFIQRVAAVGRNSETDRLLLKTG